MSDELDISRGGVIAIDTAEVRALVPLLVEAAEHIRAAGRDLGRAERDLWGTIDGYTSLPGFGHLTIPVRSMIRAAEGLAPELEATASDVTLMAQAYDIVERRAQVEALVFRGAATAALRANELALFEAEHAEAAERADELTAQWRTVRFKGLDDAAILGALVGSPLAMAALGALYAAQRATERHGFGRYRPATPRSIPWEQVHVTTRRAGTAVAPVSVSDAAARIPKSQAQVRVERYTMPGGTRQYVVYADGTRTFGGDDAWSMASNVSLYAGEAGASYQAIRQTLRDAGARPGDIVHAWGYSQGAMGTGFLVTAGEYDVRTEVTFGSPVASAAGDDTLSIQFRHTDDPVSMLSGGGRADAVGGAGSLVVTREGHPGVGPGDVTMKAHHWETYTETIRLFEASDDVRSAALDPLWATLGEATTVEAFSSTATVGLVASDELSGGASSSEAAGSRRRSR